MDSLPDDIARVLARIRGWDPAAADALKDAFLRLLRATDALAWARDRVPALAAAGSDRALLERLVEEAADLTGAPEVWALTWEGEIDAGRVRFRALAGRGAVGRTDRGTVTPETLSRSIVGQAARRRRPVWSDDAVDDARFLSADSVQSLSIRSVGCVPIGAAGALYLCDPDTPARFEPPARARISALAALVGALLGDARVTPAAPPPEPLPDLVGDSDAMREIAATVRAFAPMPWPVLVLGETGTGKEAVARAIHRLSPRRDAPFVAVNCATLTETLAESTLFGHERGAFTGADRPRAGLIERTEGGTLFLDEVGELSPRVQPKLLRLLAEGTYERLGDDRVRTFAGRIVAATWRPVDRGDLRDAAGDGFRDDLFWRLSTCVIRLPPLRDRPEDLPAIAHHLLARTLSEIPGAPALSLAPGALRWIEAQRWPGNVRELHNALRAATARALAEGSDAVEPRHLPGHRDDPPEDAATDLVAATEAFQRGRVRTALARAGGNKTAAAQRLGVSRQWLHKLIARWEQEGAW